MLTPDKLEKSDNLRLVRPDRLPAAKAAIKFIEAIKAGVAIERAAPQDRRPDAEGK